MSHSVNGASGAVGNKKRTRRFNLIDALLILIALALVLALIYLFAPFSWIKNIATKDTQKIQYTVELLNVEETFIDKIQSNDVIVDSVSKNNLGTVTLVDYNTKYSELQYVNQQGVLVEYPNRYNVVVTVTATADYVSGEGYSVNGTRIAVGEKLFLRFPDFVSEGYCIGLVSA